MTSSSPAVIIRGRLNGRQRNLLKGLFNFYYTPSELAEEVGFSKDQIYRVYVPLGCPHKRDQRNHILINGIEFKKWYLETYKKEKLQENQVFCLTCKKAVEIKNPERKQKKGILYDICSCPNCGRKLAKIIDKV